MKIKHSFDFNREIKSGILKWIYVMGLKDHQNKNG